MDYSTLKKSKRKSRRRNNDFTYLEKSSSEPDLSDYTPPFSDRFKKRPQECITVDELKYFRRRRPPDLHTRSNISLYNKSEPIIPYSLMISEYSREFRPPTQQTSRPELTRRSTTLKLHQDLAVTDENMVVAAAASEQQSEYQPYTEDQALRCRRIMYKNPDNVFINDKEPSMTSGYPVSVDGTIQFTSAEPHFDSKQKSENKTNSQNCHLKLEGELSYNPEYRSQFVAFPIEKSHSIPQLSNIHFQGKFVAIPEYKDSFKNYDQYAKSAPIKNADHLSITGTVENTAGEYKDNYKEIDHNSVEKSALAKKGDQFHLMGESKQELGEYSESFKDPKMTTMPERAKPRQSFLSMSGNMDYSPEYRSTYLDFDRSRPVTKKPPSNFQLPKSSSKPSSPPRKKFEPNTIRHNYNDPNLEDLPFLCQPEVRRAKKDLLIKKRSAVVAAKEINNNVIETNVIGLPTDDFAKNYAAAPPRSAAINPEEPKSRNISPSFKLTVQNVDDIGGSFKKASPRYGRRASMATAKDPGQKIRYNTKIIEGNREYASRGNTKYGEQLQHSTKAQANYRQAHHNIGGKKTVNEAENSSFIVLNEPCKQSKWMKPMWYDN